MRVFFDTNVLLDDYYQRVGAAASKEAGSYCADSPHQGWIAWHTISNAYYLVRNHSKSGEKAGKFVADLLAWVEVTATSRSDALAALAFGMGDFEDALQLAAAVACGADVLLTRNNADFKASPIPVMTPEEFLGSLAR
jgi:predicted nucleic acid-binding protein